VPIGCQRSPGHPADQRSNDSSNERLKGLRELTRSRPRRWPARRRPRLGRLRGNPRRLLHTCACPEPPTLSTRRANVFMTPGAERRRFEGNHAGSAHVRMTPSAAGDELRVLRQRSVDVSLGGGFAESLDSKDE